MPISIAPSQQQQQSLFAIINGKPIWTRSCPFRLRRPSSTQLGMIRRYIPIDSHLLSLVLVYTSTGLFPRKDTLQYAHHTRFSEQPPGESWQKNFLSLIDESPLITLDFVCSTWRNFNNKHLSVTREKNSLFFCMCCSSEHRRSLLTKSSIKISSLGNTRVASLFISNQQVCVCWRSSEFPINCSIF